MKTTTKLIIGAVLSLSIGIAAASPLLVTELNITPWITHVQGQTADFKVDVVYANFTVQNKDTPLTDTSGPTITYFAVMKVTNLSNLAANLLTVDFMAAQKITNGTGQTLFQTSGNWSTGQGWDEPGAWVDDVWYNVTWTNGQYPYFAQNGTVINSPFPSAVKPHWMQGVELYERTTGGVNGATTSIYMNMNGTWTDVTGRIKVDMPQNGPSYSATGSVARQMLAFQSVLPSQSGNQGNSSNVNGNLVGFTTTYVEIGNGFFNNLFEPHQSRLITVSGTWDLRKPYVDANHTPLEALQSGSLDLKTDTLNVLNNSPGIVNNTMVDTWSQNTELKQINLTQNGDSYIYNAVLSSNQMFQLDKFGVEAFIVPKN